VADRVSEGAPTLGRRVTVARAATDTFAGIRPTDLPGFVSMQLLGASAAAVLWRWLAPGARIDER